MQSAKEQFVPERAGVQTSLASVKSKWPPMQVSAQISPTLGHATHATVPQSQPKLLRLSLDRVAPARCATGRSPT